MRKRERYIYGGAAIGATLTTLGNMLIQYTKLKEEGKPFLENWNIFQTIQSATLGGLAGAGTGYVIYNFNKSEEDSFPFSPNKHLYNVLNELNIQADPNVLSRVLEIRDKLTTFLINKFGDMLVCKPQYSGSFYKRTAINSNFDFDIALPFKKSSFSSLEEMYETTHEEIYEKYSNGDTKVRKQRRSIGITFFIDELEFHFDIVPGREINDYKLDGNMKLYVSPGNIFQSSSSMKTNIQSHRSATANKPTERKIIKLLKYYRDTNSLNFPSPIIQNLVIEAFDNKNHSSPSLYNNFIYAMEYIADKIHKKNLIDISNSNNNMMKKISQVEKEAISNQLNKDLDRLEKDTCYLKEIFEF